MLNVEYQLSSEGDARVRAKNLTVHVVLPNGEIKGMQVSPNLASPWLDIEVTRDHLGRANGIRSVRFTAAAERAGFKFLAHLYAADELGKPGYDAYVRFEQSNRGKMHVPEFPEDSLPVAVVELRQGHRKIVVSPDSLPKRKAKASAKTKAEG